MVSNEDVEQLRRDLEQARQRIAEVESRVKIELSSKDAPPWLYATLEMAEVGVWHWDMTLDEVFWSDFVYKTHGLSPDSFNANLSGALAATVEEDRARVGQEVQRSLTTGEPYNAEYRIRRPDGEVRWLAAKGKPSMDENGKAYRLAGTLLDVTERRREEEEKLAMQQRVIDAQRETLRELGAPVIPLADQTLAVLLVGLLTRERTEQVSEAVLNAVREMSAQVVLLDVTGVPSVDAVVAQALVRAAHAVRLLGSQVVLTGVRPQVAQTLVELGIDMQRFTVKANLQSGIEYAARLRRRA